MLTDHDREIRRGRITGSTAAACLGLSPFLTPLAAWLEITGRNAEHDEATRAVFRRGHVLEPALIRYGAEEIASELRRTVAIDRPGTLAHRDLPWAAVSADAVYLTREIPGEPPGVVELDDLVIPDVAAIDCYVGEAKAVNAEHASEWGAEWSDQIPAYVAVQAEWELLHYPEARAVILPVLLGAQQQLTAYVWRGDAALRAGLVDALGAWHRRHVVTDTPPPATAPRDAAIIGDVWRAREREHPDDPRIAALVVEDDEQRRSEAAAKKRRASIKIAIGEILQGSTACAGPWGRVTWTDERSAAKVDTEAAIVALEAEVPGAGAVMRRELAAHTTSGTHRVMRTRIAKSTG